MKPGLKRYRSTEALLRPRVKSLAAVHSFSASLQFKGTWTWHASWSFREGALEPESKMGERVFLFCQMTDDSPDNFSMYKQGVKLTSYSH